MHYIEKFDIPRKELSADSIIVAYSGFGDRYNHLNESVRDFIRHNFRGCKCIVIRKGKKLKLSSQEIESGDKLLKIYDFPKNLRKFTSVNPKLVKALKHRDITRFDIKQKTSLSDDSKRDLQEIINLVSQATKRPSPKAERRRESIHQTNTLIEKVNESINVRTQATHSVEEAMDNARRGRVNIDEIRTYVDNISQNSSADALSAIASIKASDQTYAHCTDVGAIFQSVYSLILQETGKTSVFDSVNQAILSGFLHDFGKSKVPKDLLESTSRFERDSQEMKVMMAHPEYGAKILTDLNMPSSVVNMAHYHHVKQDTSMLSSYPRGCRFEDASFETRLLSIVDAYQALVGRRRYKKSWSPPATMRYIEALSGVEYDYEVWVLFLKIMGLYPKGSLVELSNHAIGFVVSVPKDNEDMERPIVAVVRNQYGEDLEHNDLVDLRESLDVSIIKDLDCQEVLGSNALDVFMGIEISG